MVTVRAASRSRRSRSRSRSRNQPPPPPPVSDALQTFLDKSALFLEDFDSFRNHYQRIPRRGLTARVVTKFDDELYSVEKAQERAHAAYSELSREDMSHPLFRGRFREVDAMSQRLNSTVERWLDIAEEAGLSEQLHRRD